MAETPRDPGAVRDPESIIDALADLLQLAATWVRQQAGSIMREKIVLPLQKLGITVASAFAAGCLLVIGLIFVAVGAIIGLGHLIGFGWTFFLIGAVFLIGSAVFLVIKGRNMQR